VSVVIAVAIGVLYATGTYLVMQRMLTRVVFGLGLIGNGSVLVLLSAGGPRGAAPFVGADGPTADPLPQALALTAIVIAFGVMVFLLALAYRSWILSEDDEVEDDLEDARLLGPHRAERVEVEQDALEDDLEHR
jgi:multicomponent Na+:H+ antiporter subunit C